MKKIFITLFYSLVIVTSVYLCLCINHIGVTGKLLQFFMLLIIYIDSLIMSPLISKALKRMVALHM